ncbi:putative group 1 glycosyl transferase [Nostoc carneum NIES-2107]|nr:putative group 1 glycosyl transferase [Nostoc carneum NIES-2107]
MKSLLIIAAIPETINSFLLPFAYHFRAKGWRVDAMAQGVSASTECLAAFDRIWDVDLARSPLDPRNLLIAPQQIREVIAQEKYDIVHVHMAVAAFVTRYALKDARKQGIPKMIYTSHGLNFYRGGKPLDNAIFLTLEKLAGRWTDYLVVMNYEDEEAAKQYHIVPPERVRYMPGIGVDLQQFNVNAVASDAILQVRQEMGLTAETQLLLCIAEFIPRKRHQDLLRAFAKVAKPNSCLALAGDGPLKAQMQQLAAELGILDRVRFLGFRRDIANLIGSAIATILVSEQEGLPRSIMESLCMQVPVIGSDIRGIRDLLEGGCGLLVQLGDIAELANAIAYILDHPQEAKAMGKRGWEIMANYDLQHILQLHESLYAEALNQVNYPAYV